MTRLREKKEVLRRSLVAVSVSTTFGLIVWLLFEALDVADIMSYTFLFGVPFAVGAISVFVAGWSNFGRFILLPILAVPLLLIAAFLLGVDGALCLVIMVIPFFCAAILGGVFISVLRFAMDVRQTSAIVIAALPFVAGPIETQFNGVCETNEVVTSVIVNAGRQEVWKKIGSVDSIREDELSWTLIHAVGVPKPVSAVLDREGIGGVRYITWRKGITFEEHITEWQEGRGFSYRFVIDTTCLPLYALDKHVRAGGEYFDVLDGGYRLVDLPGNRTLLQLRCRYRLNTRFNWYARFWGDLIMNDFQRVIANVIKGRVEKEGGRVPGYSLPTTGSPAPHRTLPQDNPAVGSVRLSPDCR